MRTTYAYVLVYHGEPDKALEQLEAARRLNPLDPREYLTLNAIALVHLVSRRFAEVLRWTERTIQQRRTYPPPYRFRAAALAHLGRMDEAAATITEVLKLQPNSTVSRAARIGFRNPEHRAILLEGLRKAGLPE